MHWFSKKYKSMTMVKVDRMSGRGGAIRAREEEEEEASRGELLLPSDTWGSFFNNEHTHKGEQLDA